MSLATNILPHLPYLRRYARALSGTQKGGDAYVAAVLEALIDDPNDFDTSLDTKVALYRAFCRLWESVTLNLTLHPGTSDIPVNSPKWAKLAEHRVAIIPPRAREAFLLAAVEGFSRPAIAAILSRDEESVAKLLDEAAQAIVDQVATSVMIIEDEPLIALDIRSIVENLGHTVTGVARTHRQAAALASQNRPGLILADIQLADGSSGIEAVDQILTSFEVPVIFITAFPERLLTGERREPAFLITKPFTPEMVKAVVSQALFFDTAAMIAA
jgi:CheY-like chemotaxis protein